MSILYNSHVLQSSEKEFINAPQQYGSARPGNGIEQPLFREQRLRRLQDVLQALCKERSVLHLYGIVLGFQQRHE